MNILVDSNVLVRLLHHASPQHQLAIDATQRLRSDNETLCLVPQTIYEVWNVASRPTNVNGLGLSFGQVQKEIANIKRFYVLLDETPAVFAQWELLVAQYSVVGKNVHDAHLVAAMMVHGITRLLTFNKQDFTRYSQIAVMTPVDVMAAPP